MPHNVQCQQGSWCDQFGSRSDSRGHWSSYAIYSRGITPARGLSLCPSVGSPLVG